MILFVINHNINVLYAGYLICKPQRSQDPQAESRCSETPQLVYFYTFLIRSRILFGISLPFLLNPLLPGWIYPTCFTFQSLGISTEHKLRHLCAPHVWVDGNSLAWWLVSVINLTQPSITLKGYGNKRSWDQVGLQACVSICFNCPSWCEKTQPGRGSGLHEGRES